MMDAGAGVRRAGVWMDEMDVERVWVRVYQMVKS